VPKYAKIYRKWRPGYPLGELMRSPDLIAATGHTSKEREGRGEASYF